MTQPPEQPGYGTQPGPGDQPGYGSQPGYGTQPGYPTLPAYPAQPGYGLPGYPAPGQHPYGSPAPYGSPYQPYPGGPNPYRFGKDPRLAEWWQRFLARLIDGLVIGVLTSWTFIPTELSFFHQVSTINNQDVGNPAAQQAAISSAFGELFVRLLLLAAVIAVVTFFYDWLQHGLWGQTIGKRALGTIVVTADNWSKISSGTAAGRAAVYALPTGVPYAGGIFALINELWLLWDDRRQCLHDKAARTVVVKKNLLDGQGAPHPGYPGYVGPPVA